MVILITLILVIGFIVVCKVIEDTNKFYTELKTIKEKASLASNASELISLQVTICNLCDEKAFHRLHYNRANVVLKYIDVKLDEFRVS